MANRCENLLTVQGEDLKGISTIIKEDRALGYRGELPVVLEELEGTITFAFDSADNPEEKWVLDQIKVYPNLEFVLSYHEGGCFQCGQLTIQNGLKRVDKEWKSKCEEAIAFLEDTFGWDNYPV
jgi:hypothetical protein